MDGGLVDRDTETRSGEGRCPSAVTEGDVFAKERFADEMAIVTALTITETGDRAGKVSPRRGEDAGFADLATERIAKASLMGGGRHAEGGDQATAFGEAEVEEIGPALFGGGVEVFETGDGLIEHDRDANPIADTSEILDVLVGDRLFDGGELELAERGDAVGKFVGSPGTVGVDAEVDAVTKNAAQASEAGDVIAPGDSNLHFHITKVVDFQLEQTNPFAPTGLGCDGGTVADLGGEVSDGKRFGNESGDGHEGLICCLTGGIDQGQFHCAAERIPETGTTSRGDLSQREGRRETGDEVAETGPFEREKIGPGLSEHQSPGVVDRFSGDIVARKALAPANLTRVESTANDERLGVVAGVRGMSNAATQRNADAMDEQFGKTEHAGQAPETARCGQISETRSDRGGGDQAGIDPGEGVGSCDPKAENRQRSTEEVGLRPSLDVRGRWTDQEARLGLMLFRFRQHLSV